MSKKMEKEDKEKLFLAMNIIRKIKAKYVQKFFDPYKIDNVIKDLLDLYLNIYVKRK